MEIKDELKLKVEDLSLSFGMVDFSAFDTPTFHPVHKIIGC